MSQAPEGMQCGVIMLDTGGLVFGMPVFLPINLDYAIYETGETIARACWPGAQYLYTEYLP